jgi:hypothetical protein
MSWTPQPNKKPVMASLSSYASHTHVIVDLELDQHMCLLIDYIAGLLRTCIVGFRCDTIERFGTARVSTRLCIIAHSDTC